MEARAVLALSITSAFALAVALLTLSEWYDRRRGINDGVGASPHGRFRLALICAAIATVGVLYPAKALPIAGLILAALVLLVSVKLLLARNRLRRFQCLLTRFNQGDAAGALRDARVRCEQKPRDAAAWVALTALLFQNQDWEAAEQAIKHYDRLRPEGTELMVIAPIVVKNQGRSADADALYKASIGRHPNDVGLLLGHCRLLLELGRVKEASASFETARRKRQQLYALTKEGRALLDQQFDECGALVAAHAKQHNPES